MIAGRYGWEGLGGQGLDCEWLAGLVWEGLGGLGIGCEWLAGLVSRVCVYVDWRDWAGLQRVSVGGAGLCKITAASSNDVCGRVLGLLCMGRYRAGSSLAVHFVFFLFFSLLNFSKC